MDIKEIHNEGVNPIVPSFKCDIRLDEHTKHKIPYPLLNRHGFVVIQGRPRAGKTSLMTGLLTTKANKRSKRKQLYRGIFDKIYLIAPPSSMRSLKKNVFAELPPEQIGEDLDVATLMEMEKKIEANAEEEMNSLLIIDDMAEKLKNKDIAYTLNRLIQNRRHKRLYIMILVQVFNKLPVSTRKLIDQLFIIGKPVIKKETQNIFEELVFQDKNVADCIIEYTFKSPHDHLMLDTESGEFFKNFNKLIINNNISTNNKDVKKKIQRDRERSSETETNN